MTALPSIKQQSESKQGCGEQAQDSDIFSEFGREHEQSGKQTCYRQTLRLVKDFWKRKQ